MVVRTNALTWSVLPQGPPSAAVGGLSGIHVPSVAPVWVKAPNADPSAQPRHPRSDAKRWRYSQCHKWLNRVDQAELTWTRGRRVPHPHRRPGDRAA